MFFVSVLNYTKIFSALDLKTLMLISYTWRSYRSQRSEWWSGAVREDEAIRRRQKAEKGRGGRGGIWGMASGEVPGNSHHFGIMWHRVVANVPSNTFLLTERQGNPSGLVPAKPSPLDGHCLPCGLFPLPRTSLSFFPPILCCFWLYAGVPGRMALTGKTTRTA